VKVSSHNTNYFDKLRRTTPTGASKPKSGLSTVQCIKLTNQLCMRNRSWSLDVAFCEYWEEVMDSRFIWIPWFIGLVLRCRSSVEGC
jgi:hypothetical protein